MVSVPVPNILKELDDWFCVELNIAEPAVSFEWHTYELDELKTDEPLSVTVTVPPLNVAEPMTACGAF
jgi:hypothetical protein